MQYADIADAYNKYSEPYSEIENGIGVYIRLRYGIEDKQSYNIHNHRRESEIRVLIPVNENTDGDCRKHGKHERNGFDYSHLIGGIAEIVYNVVAHVSKIYIEADKEQRNADVYKHKLLLSKEFPEIEHACKLLPERPSHGRLDIVLLIESKQRNKAEDYNEHAHNDEQTHIVIVFADEHSAYHRTEDGAENGLRCKRRSYAAPVFVGHYIICPCVEARVVAHRAEEAHYGIGKNDRHSHQQILVVAYKLRKTEGYREYTPKDIAERDKGTAFAGTIRPSAEKEGGKGGSRRGADEHSGDYFRILRYFCIDKGIEPLIFHIPAYLPGKSESPNEEPHGKSAAFVFL